jgi:hypothetical protein
MQKNKEEKCDTRCCGECRTRVGGTVCTAAALQYSTDERAACRRRKCDFLPGVVVNFEKSTLSGMHVMWALSVAATANVRVWSQVEEWHVHWVCLSCTGSGCKSMHTAAA